LLQDFGAALGGPFSKKGEAFCDVYVNEATEQINRYLTEIIVQSAPSSYRDFKYPHVAANLSENSTDIISLIVSPTITLSIIPV